MQQALLKGAENERREESIILYVKQSSNTTFIMNLITIDI